MGINLFPQQFPPPQARMVDPNGAATNDLRYLLLALWNRLGSGDGAPTIGAGLVVLPLVQAAVFNIVNDWNQFTTVPGGGVAQLPAMQVGADCIIWNDDPANALSIIPTPAVPPAPGIEIDALGIGTGYSLAAGKMQWFRVITTTQIKSMQLG